MSFRESSRGSQERFRGFVGHFREFQVVPVDLRISQECFKGSQGRSRGSEVVSGGIKSVPLGLYLRIVQRR